MSAILSANDLNDFISPGVACIKPIETLPALPETDSNPYEVTTEDKVTASQPPPPAQISLTDCLACSGCVTSAEAMLVTLQSHTEVLGTLDTYRSLRTPWITNGISKGVSEQASGGKLFVASVSPQARASLAAVFSVSEVEAGNMIAQLLSGDSGLKNGGNRGSDFTWVLDTSVARDICLVAAADEVTSALSPPNSPATMQGAEGAIDTTPRRPILTSACPGWICYAEKTHPYVLPHLSRLKSPQALSGTLVKSILSQRFGVDPSRIWHLAIMPCFDKKLEASRSELTSPGWFPNTFNSQNPVRDVDCVITARELLHLATARNIDFSSLPRIPLSQSERIPFPDFRIDAFLFPPSGRKRQPIAAGSSGGYLHHILESYQTCHPTSSIKVTRGRNADVVEYALVNGSETIARMARYYGFRNIQNLVRTLKPSKLSRMPGARTGQSRRPDGARGATSLKEYDYVEVMACPGGCTNGGGQVKVGEVEQVRASTGAVRVLNDGGESAPTQAGPKEQKEWLARVDEAYFSASASSDEDDDDDDEEVTTQNIYSLSTVPTDDIRGLIAYWSSLTGIDRLTLLNTSYRKVESDVGKKQNDVERVVALSSSQGGGW